MGDFRFLFESIPTAASDLVMSRATPLGSACPPNATGVYALFYQGDLKYIGQASGNKGLRNRRNNYVSGDNGHTTHKIFLAQFPDKAIRRAHIEENVLMAWHVLSSGLLAKAVERALIWHLEPDWNRD